MRWNISTRLKVLGALFLAAISIGIFMPIIDRSPQNGVRARCQSNLKQIAFATKQYIQDYDNRFPSLGTVAGWRDALVPYANKPSFFHCPNSENENPQSSDYWFNARLSETYEASLSSSSQTFLFGDGYPSGDPAVGLIQMPKRWLRDEKSPAWRHLDGANYAFADGHVKWLKPQTVTTGKPDGATYTFLVQ